MTSSLSLLLLILLVGCGATNRAPPVVGILSGPYHYHDENGVEQEEYVVAASYVKWLETAGLRAMPIPYDAPDAMVDDMLPSLSAVLFPGGAADVPPAAIRLYEKAEQINNAQQHDDYFPIWGTCLGFEFLLMLASYQYDRSKVLGNFDSNNISLPLLMTRTSSHLYLGMNKNLLEQNNLTMHNHEYGISPQAMLQNEKLSAMFEATSLSQDRNGAWFVSSVEPKDPARHPYYGVQYHPEKNVFEYGVYAENDIPFEATNHSAHAIQLSLRLAACFGNLVTKSKRTTQHHGYPLIQQFPRKIGRKFEERYIIPHAADFPKTLDNIENENDQETGGKQGEEHNHLRAGILEEERIKHTFF